MGYKSSNYQLSARDLPNIITLVRAGKVNIFIIKIITALECINARHKVIIFFVNHVQLMAIRRQKQPAKKEIKSSTTMTTRLSMTHHSRGI